MAFSGFGYHRCQNSHFIRPFFADRADFRGHNSAQRSYFAPGGSSRCRMVPGCVIFALGSPSLYSLWLVERNEPNLRLGEHQRPKYTTNRPPTRTSPQHKHPNNTNNTHHYHKHITIPGTLQHRHPTTTDPKNTNILPPSTATQLPKVPQGSNKMHCNITGELRECLLSEYLRLQEHPPHTSTR